MRRQIEGSGESTKADIPYFPCTSLFPRCEHKRLLAFVTTRERLSEIKKDIETTFPQIVQKIVEKQLKALNIEQFL